jgi:hypothetical protein
VLLNPAQRLALQRVFQPAAVHHRRLRGDRDQPLNRAEGVATVAHPDIQIRAADPKRVYFAVQIGNICWNRAKSPSVPMRSMRNGSPAITTSLRLCASTSRG